MDYYRRLEDYERSIKKQTVYSFGVDLGLTKDYSAVCVIVRVEHFDPDHNPRELDWETMRPSGPKKLRDDTFEVTALHRYDLGDRHKDIARDVDEHVRTLNSRLYSRYQQVAVVLDCTGYGHSSYEEYEELGMPAKLYPAEITVGGRETYAAPFYRIPKKTLIGQARRRLEEDRLLISDELAHGPLLKRELLNYRLKQNVDTGHVSYEHARENEHDDLVDALALALWGAEQGLIPPIMNIKVDFG